MIKTEINLESGKPIAEMVRLHCEMVYAYIRAEGWSHNINDTNKLVVGGMINEMKTNKKGYRTLTLISTINLPIVRHEISNGTISDVVEETL